MRDYPFNFTDLNQFSINLPYGGIADKYQSLYQDLKKLESKYHFPAIRDDIGSFINFLFQFSKPKRIFEFGSGYGQSAFWYLMNSTSIEKIILTEKRDDLIFEFNNLNWPEAWKNIIDYHQNDAFKVFETESNFDFILIDGVKADYLKFLELSYDKLNENGLVLIDNSYWRGSFLDEEMVKKKETARKIKELHTYIKESNKFQSCFIPYEDGVTLLKKV